MLLLLLAAAQADSNTPAETGPIVVFQATPGLHLSASGGRIGIGLSVDTLGGVVFGDREFNTAPGIVAGPFFEANAYLTDGIEVIFGSRLGAGGLAPTATGGYIPYGMLTAEYGVDLRDSDTRRMGLHARSLYGGLGLTRSSIGQTGLTLGVEIPLLPRPIIH